VNNLYSKKSTHQTPSLSLGSARTAIFGYTTANKSARNRLNERLAESQNKDEQRRVEDVNF